MKPELEQQLPPPPPPILVSIEMTPKLYELRKELTLHEFHPAVRSYVNLYFEWLKNLKPEDVIDGIQNGTTVEDAYKKLSISSLKFGIAAARGILKVNKKYQEKLRKAVTLNLALQTLKYENPTTYELVQRYGDIGENYVKLWIEGSLKLLGVQPNE